MNDVWTCCHCGSTNVIANCPVKCPLCPHSKCPGCHVGRPAAEFGPPGPLFTSQNTAQPAYRVNSPFQSFQASQPVQYNVPSAAPRYSSMPATANARQNANFRSTKSAPPRTNPPSNNFRPMYTLPPRDAWWYCCRCNHLNNPDLSPDRCSSGDNHPKCIYCRAA